MLDEQLSKAICVYYGGSTRSGSYPDDVVRTWGPVEGATLNSRIREITDELFAVPPDWKTETLLQASNRAKLSVAARHPELSDAAIDQLGNYFAFEWK
jgi:hypothetical protein